MYLFKLSNIYYFIKCIFIKKHNALLFNIALFLIEAYQNIGFSQQKCVYQKQQKLAELIFLEIHD